MFPDQDAWRLCCLFPWLFSLWDFSCSWCSLQCASRVAAEFPFCVLSEALNSASSVECFGSCILRTWCLWVRWMQCKFPVLQALLFFACGTLFCLIWVLYPAAHSHWWHAVPCQPWCVRPLAREAGGWCLWEKESHHREVPSGCFSCHCFHRT